MQWDGVQREVPQWNKNHTLRTAFKHSAIWFYQEMAKRIGQEQMQRYINLTNYGNRDISGGIDQFWLQGGLRISAKEQIDFLVRETPSKEGGASSNFVKLYRNQLPFSQKTIDTVKDIAISEQTPNYVLRGKTGCGEASHSWAGTLAISNAIAMSTSLP